MHFVGLFFSSPSLPLPCVTVCHHISAADEQSAQSGKVNMILMFDDMTCLAFLGSR